MLVRRLLDHPGASGPAAVVAFAVGAILLAASPASAQQRGPTQNGGIVDGEHREPVPSQVLPQERRDGVASTPAQADRNGATVEQLDKKLLDQERADPPTQGSIPPLQSR